MSHTQGCLQCCCSLFRPIFIWWPRGFFIFLKALFLPHHHCPIFLTLFSTCFSHPPPYTYNPTHTHISSFTPSCFYSYFPYSFCFHSIYPSLLVSTFPLAATPSRCPCCMPLLPVPMAMPLLFPSLHLHSYLPFLLLAFMLPQKYPTKSLPRHFVSNTSSR